MGDMHASVGFDEETQYFNGLKWKSFSEYEPGDSVLQYTSFNTANLVVLDEYFAVDAEDTVFIVCPVM